MDVNLPPTILWGCTGDILSGPLHLLYLTKLLLPPPSQPTKRSNWTNRFRFFAILQSQFISEIEKPEIKKKRTK